MAMARKSNEHAQNDTSILPLPHFAHHNTNFGVEQVAAMTSRVSSGPTNLPVNHQMK
jgi:hypothetical protein